MAKVPPIEWTQMCLGPTIQGGGNAPNEKDSTQIWVKNVIAARQRGLRKLGLKTR